eukprot:scaffold3408_cov129-Amphora_coffeaeformis.AAC.10
MTIGAVRVTSHCSGNVISFYPIPVHKYISFLGSGGQILVRKCQPTGRRVISTSGKRCTACYDALRAPRSAVLSNSHTEYSSYFIGSAVNSRNLEVYER